MAFADVLEIRQLTGAEDIPATSLDMAAEVAPNWTASLTTNPIESTFATVKLRSRVTKGAGSRAAGLTMTFKLLRAAGATWRRIDGQALIPLVRAGVRFVDGKLPERDNEETKIEQSRKAGKTAA